MNNTDLLLSQILDDANRLSPSDLRQAEKFSLFVATQTLKNFALSTDQLVAGLTDGGKDGGIDSFYAFAGGTLIEEDFDTGALNRGFSLEIYIFQDKETNSFDETPFDKFSNSLPELLNAAVSLDTSKYSAKLLEKFEIFRDFLTQTLRKFPSIKVHVIYSTKASTDNIAPEVLRRGTELENLIKGIMGTRSESEVIFQGSQTFIDYSRSEISRVLELNSNAQAAKTGSNAYAALIPIKEYYSFLTDDEGRLQRWLFDSNVRDYEGNVEVNSAIQDTLETPASTPDFWWLNNGITILSSSVIFQPGRFTIEDPQVVNGLQTSQSIFDFFDQAPEDIEDERLVLVKIIETADELIRNQIIVASNSQTKLLPTAIKAVDKIQIEIEDYFLSQGFYYERRKNHYKNLGKPADETFSLPFVGQAMIAIGFSEPDQARARPSTLLKQPTDSSRIFDPNTSLITYLWVAKLHRGVQKELKKTDESQEFKNNMPFYLSMVVARELTGTQVHHPSQLNDYVGSMPDIETSLQGAIEKLKTYLSEYMAENPEMSMDKVAKSKDFRQYVLNKASL